MEEGGEKKRHRIGEDGEIRSGLPSFRSSAELSPFGGAAPPLGMGSVVWGEPEGQTRLLHPLPSPWKLKRTGAGKQRGATLCVCVSVWESSRNSPALPGIP